MLWLFIVVDIFTHWTCVDSYASNLHRLAAQYIINVDTYLAACGELGPANATNGCFKISVVGNVHGLWAWLGTWLGAWLWEW